ncbi:hypothetical protein BDA99DRAFT_21352 [Phascolomyces articulosus]|uniref:Uncharacterized protein n=1 Tax=Phascolomyces articulosus TaxID=60185 RepID=A0AAD5KD39_9FUNG|nr:hypothetical protein BDA99DRAFT_21352 [Phascolomyces articulosus]
MADDPSSDNQQLLDRHCFDGVCHCDWRISIYDCQESVAMWYVNAVNIAIAAISVIIGLFMFVHRVFIKGHTLWYHPNALAGFLRPRPVDCMLLLFILYNIFRILSSAILMTDAVPGGWIVRSFMFEFSWSFGLGGITIYLIGVANSISHSNSTAGWLPSSRFLDIVGTVSLLGPAIFGIPLAIGAGACAENDLIKIAEILIRTSYFLWFIWVAGIGTSVLFAGIRLIRILENHHKRIHRRHSLTAVKSGINKIKMTVATFVICLWTFSGVLLSYCIARDKIIENPIGSIFIGTTWSILGSLTTLVAIVSIVFSPNMKTNPALLFNSKSRIQSNNAEDQEATIDTRPDQDFGESTVMAGAAVTFQDDNEALLHVIQENERMQQEHQLLKKSHSSKSKKSWKKFTRSLSKRDSDASSQLELTYY